MDNKNKSGKTPLFALYERKTPLFYKSVVMLIFIAQLFVMYIIQNNFQSVKFRALGVLLLALSLVMSSLSMSLFLKRIKNESK